MFPSPSKAPRFREPALPGGARGRSRLRAIGVWGLVAVGTVAALWPVRLPAATSSPIQANRRSLLFAGEDVAALQRVELRLAFDRPGTLTVAPVDLGVAPDGARVEEEWGTTDASLDGGLYVTPKGFPFDPADERRSFPFTVTVDPSVLDRARWAGLRFTFTPDGDGAEPTAVTVPVYAMPPVGFGATGGDVSIDDVSLAQSRAFTIIDRLLPNVPFVIGHGPGRASASITAGGSLPSSVQVGYAFQRLNPLSWLPFIGDRSRAYRATSDVAFLLPGERGSDATSSLVATTDGPRFESLPFIGFVRVTATARAIVDGAPGVPVSSSQTVLVFPWSESLLLVGLVLGVRRRRTRGVRRDRDRYEREGLRLIQLPEPVEKLPSRAAAASVVQPFPTVPVVPVGAPEQIGSGPRPSWLSRAAAAVSGALTALGGGLAGALAVVGRAVGSGAGAVGRRLPAIGSASAGAGRRVGAFASARARSLGEFLVWMPARIRFLGVGLARLLARGALAIGRVGRATGGAVVVAFRRATGATTRTVGAGASVTARVAGTASRGVAGRVGAASAAVRATVARYFPFVSRNVETVLRGLAIAAVLGVRAVVRTVAATPRAFARGVAASASFALREGPVTARGLVVIAGFVGRGLRAVVIAVWWLVTVVSDRVGRVLRIGATGTTKVVRVGASGTTKVVRAGATGTTRVVRAGVGSVTDATERAGGWLVPRLRAVALAVWTGLGVAVVGLAFVLSVATTAGLGLLGRGVSATFGWVRARVRNGVRDLVVVLGQIARGVRAVVVGIVWVGALGGTVLGWLLRDASVWAAPRIRSTSRNLSRVLLVVLAALGAIAVAVLRVVIGAAARATGALLRAVERAAARIADLEKKDPDA